jgi:hypothetical protein
LRPDRQNEVCFKSTQGRPKAALFFFFYDGTIRVQAGAFGGHDNTLPIFSGTGFRYCIEFRFIPEYSGTGFRYMDLSG